MRVPAIFCYLLVYSASAAAPFSKTSRIELRPLFHRQFKQPVFVTPYPAELAFCPDAYAVVEKHGLIRLESPERSCGGVLLDLRATVSDPTLEEGLLGLAFSTDFTRTGRYYVYYTAASPRRTVISRMTVKAPTGPGESQEEELLTIRQPYSNHNGGMLEFGPDGYLYVGVGDGGSAGDPRGYAQNLRSHLGKILRLDVSTRSGFAVPPDNPFSRSSGDAFSPKREIFAWGLRNPWRFSFTPAKTLIVGDVGQNDYEELSVVTRGANMGWNIMEGFHCFNPRKNCPQQNLVLPFHEYDHGIGQSILAGYVYEGTALPRYRGRYIFADSVSGRVFALDYRQSAAQRELLIQAPGLWSSFGRLRSGELVLAELQSGKIFLLAPTAQVSENLPADTR